ncbi:MAG: NAD(P)H-hydrate dehydratase [Acidobacteria bacterium]|nr:MAG: NAD(P)H-hydrate dehydratase [Acidobacteriota bacterium]
MEVLDAERMRAADRHAIDGMKIPSLVLMENAGRLTAETILEEMGPPPSGRAAIFCGPGNNGGDGFVVARHLAAAGVEVTAVLLGRALDDLRGDAATMAAAWTGLGGRVIEIRSEEQWRERAPELGRGDLAVDAIFGTGLTRPLRGVPRLAAEAINASDAAVVAVDIPSGLDASSPALPGPAVAADLTVTFARPKVAHLLPPAEGHCGNLVVVDIGIPDAAIAATAPDLHVLTDEEAGRLWPPRPPDSHKGTYGHVLVVGGGVGKSGAAALAGLGALRAGAGLVTVAVPRPVRPEVASVAPELMTEPLPADQKGRFAASAARAALALAATRTVAAVGPGLGTAGDTPAAVRRFVREAPVPLVIDADGLNAFAGVRLSSLARRRAPAVLTPHPGEAARLLGTGTAEIQGDRLAAARRLAKEADAVCLLKGHRTVVAAPDGRAFVNVTGNPGLATGGAGDVLTGIVAGLLAQGLDPLEAAALAAHLHGAAADLATDDERGTHAEASLTAGDLLDWLGAAIRQRVEAPRRAARE